jgi:hypothetical protein
VVELGRWKEETECEEAAEVARARTRRALWLGGSLDLLLMQ